MSEMQETYHSLTSPLARQAPRWSKHSSGAYHVSVTRAHRQNAIETSYLYMNAITAGMSDWQILGYLLNITHGADGHTVQGAVIYEDNEPDTNNERNRHEQGVYHR